MADRGGRWTRHGRRVTVPAVAAGVLTSLAVVAGPASAAWQAVAVTAAATLRSAVVGARVDVHAAGQSGPAGSSSATIGSALLAGPVYADIVTTSTVTAVVTVTLRTAGALSVVTTAESCSMPWSSAGTCAGVRATQGSTTITSLSTPAQATWTVTLPVAGRQYLRVSTALGVASDTTLSVTAQGQPRDRTLS